MNKRRSYIWLLPTLLIGVVLIAILMLNIPGSDAAPTATFSEVIDYGDYMAQNGTHIYYNSVGNLEISCDDDPGLIFGRVPNGLGLADRDQLQTGCEAFGVNAAMVASSEHIYYITPSGLHSAHSLFRRPLSGHGPAQQLTSDFAVDPRALAIDDNYVYFAVVDSAIGTALRVDLSNSSVSHAADLGFVEGSRINQLAVDNDYLYWTDGDETIPGRVGRVQIGSDTVPETVADALSYPRDIAIEGSWVYWTELGGQRIARHLKSGAGPINEVYKGDLPVQTLTLFGSLIYFGEGTAGSQNGAIKRTHVNGGPATLMAFGIGAPKDILVSNNYVYWVDGRFKRLPSDAESDGVDYVVERMEVTQAIQNSSNDVPLVASKQTYVRVYASEAEGGASTDVRALLHGFRGSEKLNGSPLSPIQAPALDLAGSAPLRSETDRTYLFLLPANWVSSEELRLQAETNPAQAAYENDYSNNFFPSVPQTFTAEAHWTCIVTHPVAALDAAGDIVIYEPPSAGAAQTEDYFAHMNRAQSLLPTILDSRPTVDVLWLLVGEDIVFQPFDLSNSDDRLWLVHRLLSRAELSDPPPGCSDVKTIHAGLVHDSADTNDSETNRGLGGEGFSSGVLWAKMRAHPGDFSDFNQPLGRMHLAHGLGHVWGRGDVDCNDPPYPDPDYPYDPCQIDDSSGEDAHWGFDPISWRALDPTAVSDFMSFQDPSWVSDYTWEGIIAAMNAQDSAQAAADIQQVQALPVIYVPALANLDGGNSTISPSFRFASEADLTVRQRTYFNTHEPSGTIRIELRDAIGLTLESRTLTPKPNNDSEIQELPQNVTAVMVYEPATTEIVMLDNKTHRVLASRKVSANPPQANSIVVTADNGADTLTIDWQAADADGDTLYATAQHVAPDGRKTSLFAPTPQETMNMKWQGSTSALAGGPGTVRLHISDGINTVMVEKSINLRHKAPQVHILQPQYEPGVPEAKIVLSGGAQDAEDGRLPESAFKWFVDGQPAGGGILVIITPRLPGKHDIELHVTDSDGQTSVARRELTINDTPSTWFINLPAVFSNDQ